MNEADNQNELATFQTTSQDVAKQETAALMPGDTGEHRYALINKCYLFNNLPTLTRKTAEIREDEVTKAITMTRKEIQIECPPGIYYTAADGQFMDLLLLYANAQGVNSTIIFSADEYMEIRGLKNRKSAIVLVKKRIGRLRFFQMTWTEKGYRGKLETRTINGAPVLANQTIEEISDGSGIFQINLSPEMQKHIKSDFCKNVMNYPLELQRIDTQKNPAAYQMGRYIALIKDIKESKNQSSDILRVRMILENAPSIPTPAKVKENERHYKRDIIEPFIKALDSLHFITWKFCKAKRIELTEEELKRAKEDISFFLTLYISFEWKDYPDMSKIKEQRAKRIEENKARKEKAQLIALASVAKKKLEAAEAAKATASPTA